MRKGQIWVETVLYTLIGLALIGVVLGLAMPKINESRDRALVGQSIESMNVIDGKIREVLDKGQGNVRRIETFNLKKGELEINSTGDNIVLTLDDLAKPYSEPGAEIKIGNVKLISELGQKKSLVRIKLDYEGIVNLTYSNSEELKKFNAGSIPYSFTFENKGIVNGSVVIDIEEVSRG